MKIFILGVSQMKTYMAHEQNVVRKWYVVDAEGMVLGRLASQVAAILRGKNKPTYTPNVDTGDYVIVVNADKVVLTGKKLEKKYYKYHTGFIGHLKSIQYKTLMETKSDFVVYEAIKGMLPKNRLGRKMINKLKVYKGPEHNNQAQKPEVLKLV
jgi:large subunit ribosomal protein L13